MSCRRVREPDEPTSGDLQAIEREWPLIEAELALLDAQIAILAAEGRVSPLDWRRLRRAERRVTRELAAQAGTTAPGAAGEVA